MICPWCDKTFTCIDAAQFNADTYSKPVKVRADCCGNAVQIVPIRTFRLVPRSDVETDDWGQSIQPTFKEPPNGN